MTSLSTKLWDELIKAILWIVAIAAASGGVLFILWLWREIFATILDLLSFSS